MHQRCLVYSPGDNRSPVNPKSERTEGILSHTAFSMCLICNMVQSLSELSLCGVSTWPLVIKVDSPCSSSEVLSAVYVLL